MAVNLGWLARKIVRNCPRFEIRRFAAATGNCSTVLTSVASEITESACLDLCLDTPGCRGAAYDGNASVCTVYDCGDTFTDSDSVFYQRICVEDCERNVTQTCINCLISPDCQMPFELTHYVGIGSDCLAQCNSSDDCSVSLYLRSSSRCYVYNCSRLSLNWGGIAYRKTFNADCPRFEIRRFAAATGNCSTVLTSVASEITESACLDLCLDTPGCRGAAYDGNASVCTVYDCGDTLTDSDSVFYRRLCVQDCERNVTQTCINCLTSPDCQMPFELTHYVGIGSDCLAQCNSSDDCSVSSYLSSYSRCLSYNCSRLSLNWGGIAYRKTCNADCPRFEIRRFAASTGNCSTVLTSVASEIIESACLDLCLDTPGCRGASYDGNASVCNVFDCGDT
ncbi:uncharacterized protein LOC128223182 [Mya arenaria]|uniref:uncharacterized protein LOC128223182 n=1 Tax=Mya arenaria TaxID=6604 RepID=UPI0022E8F7D7|nr:uncharacterized protein LOC128223182 [Mya arenaria]